MRKHAERPITRVIRPARTPIEGVRARLGDLQCTLANLSSSGAMLHSVLEVSTGRETTLVIELPVPVTTTVRVVRCDPVDVALPGAAVWRKHDFGLGVHFLRHHDGLAAAIRSLAKQTGIEQSHARVLVFGKDDDVNRLVNTALSDADYEPRVLNHQRYVVSIAKRIGAKAVVVNLDVDEQISVRSLLDTLQADPVTAAMPLIVCAMKPLLQPEQYAAADRLRVLLTPFSPEELVATVDRAIDELS